MPDPARRSALLVAVLLCVAALVALLWEIGPASGTTAPPAPALTSMPDERGTETLAVPADAAGTAGLTSPEPLDRREAEPLAGARDVEVVLPRASKLILDLLLEPEMLTRHARFRAELRPTDAKTGPRQLVRSGDLLRAVWDSVGPGTQRLRAWVLGDPEPLVDREVKVAATPAARKQTVTIDLRGTFRVVQVVVVNAEDGSPVDRGLLLTNAAGPRHGKQTWDGFELRGGRASVLTRNAAMAFEVFARDFVPATFRGPAADVTIPVQPAAEVAVLVRGLEELPPGRRPVLVVTDPDRTGITLRSETITSPGNHLLQAVHRVDLRDGAGKLRLGRPCRLQFAVLLLGTGGAEIRPEPAEVTWSPGTGRIELNVDAAALQQALERGK